MMGCPWRGAIYRVPRTEGIGPAVVHKGTIMAFLNIGLNRDARSERPPIRAAGTLAAMSAAAALLALLGLGGCANMSPQARSTAVGATAGAAIGGALTEDGVGAALGAAAGAAVGNKVSNDSKDKEQEKR